MDQQLPDDDSFHPNPMLCVKRQLMEAVSEIVVLSNAEISYHQMELHVHPATLGLGPTAVTDSFFGLHVILDQRIEEGCLEVRGCLERSLVDPAIVAAAFGLHALLEQRIEEGRLEVRAYMKRSVQIDPAIVAAAWQAYHATCFQ